MKKIIRKILKEDQREMYLNKIINFMKNDYPLFHNLKLYGFYDQLSSDELKYVLSKILEKRVFRTTNPGSSFRVYDENEYKIYSENWDGFWKKWEHDENGNIIYTEHSGGKWWKREYDEYGNEIYFEDYYGYWIKYEYDNRGNRIYEENSYGEWFRWDFDEHDREIYYEDSDGNIEYNR